ncbi:Indoleamine 2,3-dioxygenase [Cyphellophora attinorum]|uniref:Indoleamine 2,3-dioxygenase n=1 Tax=Cyphellophora attinorum TaxID=1664694 RepID=A0A0N0NQ66_9EURO|nr:Indoleamine 2,3-dioxygenase [Phialophora attinorum]KPI43551.1 Indoleamine 2,3-dioxygenase [Phialophora attinorum]
MLPPIPRPEDYGVSPATGFLPSTLPLQCLPHQVYDRWERIVNNFQSLLLSKRLRTVIDKLPIIPAVHLETEAEWRRAYVVLVFLANGYIWEHLELPPVATYAGTVLWNYKPIFLSDPLVLDNLSTLLTFTGSLDEQWFYLVSVAIEARAGPTIPLMLDAIQAARNDDIVKVTEGLQSFAQTLDELGTILVRMYENCDPHIFYHRIRPYLAGSKNMSDAGLPNGVYYDDGTRNARFRQYGGGSNAQSSIIQFFDVVLGVEHRPTGAKMNESSESEAEPGSAPKPRHNFIHEMRQYMPGPHRRFLQAVEGIANIREYRVPKPEPIKRSDKPDPAPARGHGLASVRYKTGAGEKPKKTRGTGGTALIPFLKQARDETGEPAIDEWARNILMGGRRTEVDAEIAYQSRLTAQELDAEEPLIVGLSGAWDMEESGGGLCSY